MKKAIATLAIVTLFLLPSLLAGPTVKATDIEGDWIGGYKLGDNWVFMDARIEMEEGATKATIDFPFADENFLTETDITFKSCGMQFTVQNGAGALLFEGHYDDATISGFVKHAGKEGAFHLFRVPRS